MRRLFQIKESSSTMEHLVGVGLLLAFLLPQTSTPLLLVNPLLCLVLVILSKNRKNCRCFWIVLIPLCISLVLNIAGIIQQKALLMWLTIVMYFTLFPMVGPVKVRNSYLYICLSFIILSQFAYLLNIGGFTNFLDIYYPIAEGDTNYYSYMRSNITYENFIDYRLGGLYRNPNQCSRYLTLLLAFFVVSNRKEPLRNQFLFCGLALAAVLLTGSRTGLAVAILILFFSLFRRSELFLVKVLVVLAFIVAGFIIVSSKIGEMRGLNFQGGLSSSFNLKWVTFYNYLVGENSMLSILFGHLDSSQFRSMAIRGMNRFDTDYGNLIYCFGMVGFLLFFVFFSVIGCKMHKTSRVFFLLLFWMLGSTMIMSYRACFIFQLLLSIIYSNDQNNQIHGAS